MTPPDWRWRSPRSRSDAGPLERRPRGGGIDWAFVVRGLAIAIVVVFGIGYVLLHLSSTAGGLDARLYAAAAHAWLVGADPWDVRVDGLGLAAPPTVLPVGALLSVLPSGLIGPSSIVFTALCAVAAVRAAGVGWWWLLTIPVLEGVLVGSLDLLALALLVHALRGSQGRLAPVAAAAAGLAKLYAVLPAALLGRRTVVLAAFLVVIASAPLLPWLEYVRRLPELTTRLVNQAGGGIWSPWTTPVLVPPTVMAIVVIGRRDGAWLLIPALWPATQIHYGVFLLPVGSPVLALVSLLPVPAPAATAVIALAVVRTTQRRLDPWSWLPASWTARLLLGLATAPEAASE